MKAVGVQYRLGDRHRVLVSVVDMNGIIAEIEKRPYPALGFPIRAAVFAHKEYELDRFVIDEPVIDVLEQARRRSRPISQPRLVPVQQPHEISPAIAADGNRLAIDDRA